MDFISTAEVAQELSKRYFDKAHDLLIYQVLESEPKT